MVFINVFINLVLLFQLLIIFLFYPVIVIYNGGQDHVPGA